jgi:hypothetical protein
MKETIFASPFFLFRNLDAAWQVVAKQRLSIGQ